MKVGYVIKTNGGKRQNLSSWMRHGVRRTMVSTKNLIFNGIVLIVCVIGLQGVSSDGNKRVRRTLLLSKLLDRRGQTLNGGGIDIGFHKKITLPSLGHSHPVTTVVEQQQPIVLQQSHNYGYNDVIGTTHYVQPSHTEVVHPLNSLQNGGNYEDQSYTVQSNPIVSNIGNYEDQSYTVQSNPIVSNIGNYHDHSYTVQSNPILASNYQDHSYTVQSNPIVGNTQVYNEENQQVVEEVKRTVIEEKIPTIIKTKTPTYIEQTMQQQVIRETVPHTVKEQETHMVTETKPVYVTQTRPVTVMKDKTYMETRDRIVNVPGKQIVTKGQPIITRERGQSTVNVYEQGNNLIGFRMFNNSTQRINERPKFHRFRIHNMRDIRRGHYRFSRQYRKSLPRQCQAMMAEKYVIWK